MSKPEHETLVPLLEEENGGSLIVPLAGIMPMKSGVGSAGIVKVLPSLHVWVPAPSVSVVFPCASTVPDHGNLMVQSSELVVLVPGPVVVHVLLLWNVTAPLQLPANWLCACAVAAAAVQASRNNQRFPVITPSLCR